MGCVESLVRFRCSLQYVSNLTSSVDVLETHA